MRAKINLHSLEGDVSGHFSFFPKGTCTAQLFVMGWFQRTWQMEMPNISEAVSLY